MSFYTYKITNMKNGMFYIGEAKDIKKRWNQHRAAARAKRPKDTGIILYHAMRKYGIDNFKIEQLTEHETEEEALAQEKLFIKQLDARNRKIGYNIYQYQHKFICRPS